MAAPRKFTKKNHRITFYADDDVFNRLNAWAKDSKLSQSTACCHILNKVLPDDNSKEKTNQGNK